MPMTISLFAKTSNSITVQTATRTAGYDQVRYQVSTRPDFLFTPSPQPSVAPDGSGRIAITGLNQSNLYYIRMREHRTSDGAVLPWTANLAVFTPAGTAWDTTPLSVMVRPAILVPPEPVDWIATTPVAGYAASSLNTDSPLEQLWQTGARLDVNTPGSPIDTVALLATNFNATNTVRLRAFNTDADRTALTNVVYDSTALQAHASPNLPGRESYHYLHRMPAAITAPFLRMDLAGTAPPGTQYAFTYGVVGLARTAKNIAADKVEGGLDYGSLERTRDGTPDRRTGFRGRRVEFEIALMTEAQWETQFADLRRRVGFTDPVLVVPNTRAGSFFHDRILYGPIAQNRASQPYTPRFTQTLTIESLI